MVELLTLPGVILRRVVENMFDDHECWELAKYRNIVRLASTCKELREFVYGSDFLWEKFFYSGPELQKCAPILGIVGHHVRRLSFNHPDLDVHTVMQQFPLSSHPVRAANPEELPNYITLESDIRLAVRTWPVLPHLESMRTNTLISPAIVELVGEKFPCMRKVRPTWVSTPVLDAMQSSFNVMTSADISEWGCLVYVSVDPNDVLRFVQATQLSSVAIPSKFGDALLSQWLSFPGVATRLTCLELPIGQGSTGPATFAQYIPTCVNLKKLTFGCCKLNNDSLSAISSMNHLESISVFICPLMQNNQDGVTLQGVCDFIRHSKFSLRKFRLMATGIECFDIFITLLIHHHPKLTKIQVPAPFSVDCLGEINSLTSLKMVVFETSRWREPTVRHFLSLLDPNMLVNLKLVTIGRGLSRVGTCERAVTPGTLNLIHHRFASCRVHATVFERKC